MKRAKRITRKQLWVMLKEGEYQRQARNFIDTIANPGFTVHVNMKEPASPDMKLAVLKMVKLAYHKH